MKIRNLFCAAAAVLALAACEELVNFGAAKVEIPADSALEIPANGGSVTLDFTATVDWELQGYDDVASWLEITPESGKAAAGTQTLTLTAKKNDGAARQANLTIFGNVLTKASFSVSQKGNSNEDGTKENPYNASTALQMILDGTHDETAVVYVQGTVSEVGEVSTQYGNATYAISDDGTTTNQLDVYRGYYIDGAKFTSADQIKVGDKVVVFGNLVNYKGNTPQFTQGSKIYSLNGKTDGGSTGGGGSEIVTPEKPSTYPTAKPTPTKVTIKEFIEKEFSYDVWYELTGEIVSIVADNKYGNFTIKDETGSVYIYGMTSEWVGGENNQSFESLGLKVSDVVTLGTLRQHNPYTGEVQGGGNWMGAYYISHVAGEGPAPLPDGSIVLTFPGTDKSISSYTETWTAKSGNYEFAMENFNNNKLEWTYVKCGRKNNASVASITTLNAMPKLNKVIVSVDKFSPVSKVKSMTLGVYSDAACSTEVAGGITPAEGLVAGDLTFAVPADKAAANLYYKLVFDCDGASSNGIIQISKVTYVAAQ